MRRNGFLQNYYHNKMSGKLYIVPTPVGNLDDMTVRAINTLRDADCILAEDTRTSSVLMKHFGITTRMQSHHKFNEHDTLPALIERLEGGEVIALVSDAGTEVECLPGATAFVPAIVNSGLPCDRFCFEGFLPQKKGRATRLASLADEQRTMIFYESPLRLVKTLEQLAATFGTEREASVCREISKVHNTTHHGTLGELVAEFTATAPRGEIVIVVAGKATEAAVKIDKYADFKQKSALRE